MPRLYTIEETATLLSVCRRTVYSMIAAGDLTVVRIKSRPRIPRQDICRMCGSRCKTCGMKDVCQDKS